MAKLDLLAIVLAGSLIIYAAWEWMKWYIQKNEGRW